jgi:hypothetical protein
MTNNRWILPITIVFALIVAAGLLYQSQQLSTTQTSLNSALADVAGLQATATEISDARDALATDAAATAAALADSAAATQDALQNSAATAQANAQAALTASANDAATAQANALATADALQSSAVTAQAALTAAANDAATAQAGAQASLTAVANNAVTAQATARAAFTAVANEAATAQANLQATAGAFATALAGERATRDALESAAATQSVQALLAQTAQAGDIASARATQAALISALDTAQAEATRIAASLAEREAEIAALMTPVDAVPTRPAVVVYEPVAPVEVGALLVVDDFDNNNDDYWYEGTVDRQGVEQGRLDVVDGVYRFSYTIPNASRGLFSSAVSRTQPNLLLEYDFRVLNCDEAHDLTYVETLFYSNQAEEYGLAIFCNQVAWSLIRVSDAVERLGAERFSVSDRMLSQWHTMSLWFTDTEVTFYLDGVRLSSQTLPPDREGFFYLRIFSEDQAVVEFDNIRVWETPPTRRPGQLVPVSTPRP